MIHLVMTWQLCWVYGCIFCHFRFSQQLLVLHGAVTVHAHSTVRWTCWCHTGIIQLTSTEKLQLKLKIPSKNMSCRGNMLLLLVSKTAVSGVVWILAAHDGDYWRLLIPGRYTVTACADEQYECVSKSVVVENPPHTVAKSVDFTLTLAAPEQQACVWSVFIV